MSSKVNTLASPVVELKYNDRAVPANENPIGLNGEKKSVLSQYVQLDKNMGKKIVRSRSPVLSVPDQRYMDPFTLMPE